PIVGGGACPLDLKKAPFVLLAVTNRVDQTDWTSGAGVRDPEARMVFGLVDAAGKAQQATVIFEFKLPSQRGGAPHSTLAGASDWHALSGIALGTPAYLNTLQGILADITTAGVEPGNPNLGSAIGQVRTNEIAFGGGPPPWKMREFHLTNTGAGINAERLRA